MISILKLIKNEILKELISTLSYKFQWLGELVAVSIYYFYLSHIAFSQNFSIEGYSIWFYSIVLIGDLGGKISNEMKMGIFEQNYLSVYSIKTLLVAKLVASFIRASAILLFLQFLFFVTTFTLVSYQVYLLMIIILPALVGLSFFLAGLTVLFKDIGWISNILNNSLLFLSGIFISIELFPSWIYRFSYFFPTRLAELILQCDSIYNFPFIIYTLQCIFYPMVGYLVFVASEKRAKKTGVLAYY
jgi:ABC-type polysaccharide/polyol phosphate export permease